MNKKWIIVLLIVLLSGCINKEAKEVFVTPVTPEKENKFLYTPGTYRGEGSGYNGPIVVEVTVNESKILYIELVSHSEQNYLIDIYGNPVDPTIEDEVEDEVDDEVTDNTEDEIIEEEIETEEVEVLGSLDAILNMILLEQTTEVDTITHATVSINGLKEAVSRALAEAML